MIWEIAIARNLAIDPLRARPDHAERPDAVGEVADTTPRADALRGAYLSGLSYLDLEARHAVPLNTTETWLRHSLQRLKECVETIATLWMTILQPNVRRACLFQVNGPRPKHD
jgi:RNA polymerase sigma-70 factor (ECF subfamily)